MSTTKLRTATIVISLLAAAMPSIIAAQSDAGLSELRDYVKEYQSEWNTHDSSKVAAFFSEDGDLVLGNLPIAHGRKAVDRMWHKYFERLEPTRRGRFKIISARMLGPTTAVINIDSTTYGNAPGGEALPTRKARGTWVMRKDNRRWEIVEMCAQPVVGDRVELKMSLETAKALRPGIRGFVEEYEDAFISKDGEALAEFYTNDADIIVREQPLFSGIEAIRKMWKTYFKQPRPYRPLLIIRDIKMLSDDVALLNITATGAVAGAESKLMPIRDALAVWVITRLDGKWRIAALRVLPGRDDRIFRDSTH